MKTLSDGSYIHNICRPLFLPILIVWSALPSISAEGALHDIFRTNKQKILSRDHSEMNGFVFAVGHARVRKHDNASIESKGEEHENN